MAQPDGATGKCILTLMPKTPKRKAAKSKSAKPSKTKIPNREFLRKFGLPSFLIPGIILAAALGFNWEKLAGQDPRTNPDIFGNILAAAEIVDGDTIRLTRGLPIRLIGMDAPDKGQPMFNEAWAFLGELIDDYRVRIEYDRVQNDNYGRLRGYAFVPCPAETKVNCASGEINVNVEMVRAGLARVKTTILWQKPKYEAELKQAEADAKSHRRGVWSQ